MNLYWSSSLAQAKNQKVREGERFCVISPNTVKKTP